jgi:Uma2 family endonuclease
MQQKDLNIKTQIYAEAGISEYWVVHLKKRQLIIFREPQEIEYNSKSTLTTGKVHPLAFPDVAIEVNAIVSS